MLRRCPYCKVLKPDIGACCPECARVFESKKHQQRLYRRSKPPDHVYFIQGEKTGLIKIGRSRYVEERLEALQTGSPDKLIVLLALPNLNEFELHTRFAAHRAHGEWFHPAQPILDFIDSCHTTPPTGGLNN